MKLLFVILSCFSALVAGEIRGNIVASDGKHIALSPLGGYVSKGNPPKGEKGLQAYYDRTLSEGKDVQTSINRTLQTKTEAILDKARVDLNATEVLAMVMDSKSGAMLVMASSNRYDPLHIRQMDVSSLNPKFVEYPYEPGSVLMPLVTSIAIEHQKVTPKSWVSIGNGVLSIGGGQTISDDMDHNVSEDVALSVEDILVCASSVGISKVAWKLSGEAFHKGLVRFGLGEPTGVDLRRDLGGRLKSATLLEHKMHRANTAYGYGLMATPLQLLKAYNVFTSGGYMIQPHIGVQETKKEKILSEKTAMQTKEMLMEIVERGTAKNAKTKGLSIGGKTGTAHIAKNGRYAREYHSSFYGFAEDKDGHSYTIGVLVVEPKTPKMYFASRSAVPVFKRIVDAMIKQGLFVSKGASMQNDDGAHRLDKKIDLIKCGQQTVSYHGTKTISPLKDAKVIKKFGNYTDPKYNINVFNESITLDAHHTGAEVVAVFDGTVVFAGTSKTLGKVVVVAHKDNIHTVYAQLSHLAPYIAVGQKIAKGTVLGRVSKKLIFQVTQDEKFVNPLEVMEL